MRFILSSQLAAIVAIASLSSCELLTPAGAKFADLVARYCREPVAERDAIQTQVNTTAAPNAIYVYCAGDPKKP